AGRLSRTARRKDRARNPESQGEITHMIGLIVAIILAIVVFWLVAHVAVWLGVIAGLIVLFLGIGGVGGVGRGGWPARRY
ncbi:MAG TPA: hypothetical protein VFT42_07080, partial [Solirubrobacteraceae bacterium]|nr:hypothetical protein [Solirubrobacteraceae bacterium]